MPSITITPLQPNDTKAFIKFPWQVYAGDPYWVPPLIMDRKAFLNPRKNPFFQHAQAQLFLAHDGSRTVGRIAAVINQAHDEYHNEKAGFFGFFECMPDCPQAAAALLDAAAAWVRERGARLPARPGESIQQRAGHGATRGGVWRLTDLPLGVQSAVLCRLHRGRRVEQVQGPAGLLPPPLARPRAACAGGHRPPPARVATSPFATPT